MPGNNDWFENGLKENGVVKLENKRVGKEQALTSVVAVLRNMDKYHSSFFLLFILLKFNSL